MTCLAGCVADDGTTPGWPSDQDEALLSGAFRADRTDEDLADFDATVRAHGIEEYALMESYPEQFRFRLPLDTCYGLRAELVEKDYLGHISGCALA